jgi:hypothetical protein
MATLAPVLKPIDYNYPKALYRVVLKGERGDIKSPGYEKIVMNDSGQAQRQVEYYMYVTGVAHDAKEEKELIKEGWVDHPSKLSAEAT